MTEHGHSTDRGFSLIELLAIISIIIILTGTLLVGARSTRKSAALDQAAAEVATTIREARQYSIAVRKLDELYPSYGVYIAPLATSLILYADCVADDDANNNLDVSDIYHYNPSGAGECVDGNNVLIETRALPPGVSITSIRAVAFDKTVSEISDAVSILYISPEPTTWYSVSDTWQDTITTLIITLSDGTDSVTVSTNLHGLVSVGV